MRATTFWIGAALALGAFAHDAHAGRRDRQADPEGDAGSAAVVDANVASVVEMMNARVVPPRAQARFVAKLDSPKLGIVAPPLGGGAILQAPDQGYLVLNSPVGGPILTLATTADRTVFLNGHDKQAVVAEGASAALASLGAGLSMTDVMGILVGRLPIDAGAAELLEADGAEPGTATLAVDLPGEHRAIVRVDLTNGTPRHLVVHDPAGAEVATIAWGPFALADGAWWPTTTDVAVPSVELTVGLVWKSWAVPESVADVFSPPVPEGYETMDFATYAASMKAKTEAGQAAP